MFASHHDFVLNVYFERYGLHTVLTRYPANLEWSHLVFELFDGEVHSQVVLFK